MAEQIQAINFSRTNLIYAILPSFQSHWVYKLILVLIGSLLLTLSAKIQVPFYPVPMTMQTCVLLIISMTLGSKLASLTVLLYLVEGTLGLPVFAGTPLKGLGLEYILGPTGGYLIGFFLASYIVGYLADNGFDRTFFRAFIAMLIGTILIFLCGYVWLSGFIGLEKAMQFGVLPFFWSELFKIGLATAALPICWNIVGRKT